MPYTSRPCLICGKEFIPRFRPDSAKFCSVACRAKGPRRRGGQRRPIEDRFWEKVNKNGPTIRPELGPCYVWTANTTRNGYGHFTIGGKEKLAHRVAYELLHGPIPEGMDVLHKCDNTPCVRDEHLYLGDHGENMRDAIRKGRMGGIHHPRAKLNENSVAEIRERYANGERVAVLMEEFGLSEGSIRRTALGKHWQQIPGGGSRKPVLAKPRAKLTEEEVILIRERRAAGEQEIRLAKEYGVDRKMIYLISTGKTWKDVGGPIRGHS